MKQLPSADFRKKYTAQSETVYVTAHGKVIGKWIPFGAKEFTSSDESDAIDETSEVDPPARMTIRPVKSSTPAMVGTPTRVIDPVEMKRRETAAYRMLASRMYGRKKTAED